MALELGYHVYAAHPHSGPWSKLTKGTYDKDAKLWRSTNRWNSRDTLEEARAISGTLTAGGKPVANYVIRFGTFSENAFIEKGLTFYGATNGPGRDGAALDYNRDESVVETSVGQPQLTLQFDSAAKVLRKFRATLTQYEQPWGFDAQIDGNGRIEYITVAYRNQ